MPDLADYSSSEPNSTTPDLRAPSEAARVAAIIAQTSSDLTGRSESVVQAALVERFNGVALDISADEARRIAHDISTAPRQRDVRDD